MQNSARLIPDRSDGYDIDCYVSRKNNFHFGFRFTLSPLYQAIPPLRVAFTGSTRFWKYSRFFPQQNLDAIIQAFKRVI